MGAETMLYDPDSRKVHVLNRSSLAIWELCTGEANLEAIEAEVRRRFRAGEGDDVRKDVENCVVALSKEGLLDLENR